MDIQTSFNKPENQLWDMLHWQPSLQQLEQFILLQKLLTHFNKKVNLTRLLNREDYWVSQVFDSLWAFQQELNNPQKSFNCIDVGTGCGFPGLAMAIAMPNTTLILVDSAKRKTSALLQIVKELRLSSRVKIITERVEITGHKVAYRGMFDLAMARAVATAPVTAEYLIPLLKADGEACLFRGKWNKANEKPLIKALKKLKAEISQIQSIELPSNKGVRHLIRLKPYSLCPQNFPRGIGIPIRKPLGG